MDTYKIRTDYIDNGTMNTFKMPTKGVTTPPKEKSGRKDVFSKESHEMGQIKDR